MSVAIYQHAIRRLAEPLASRCKGTARPETVQRFVDQATGAALALAARLEGDGAAERARIRALLPYHVPCCERFLESVADLVNEHEDSSASCDDREG